MEPRRWEIVWLFWKIGKQKATTNGCTKEEEKRRTHQQQKEKTKLAYAKCYATLEQEVGTGRRRDDVLFQQTATTRKY